MKINSAVITKNEEVAFKLRSLYEQFGFAQYKMNKFEEYDLYVRNKDFLVSDNIITFTDADGKLMALKPDVTLSIVKKGDDDNGALQKVYYDEKVYRAPKGTNSFKEIMQVGLECVGDVDEYCTFEVLNLACKSLQSISDEFVLDISHVGVVREIIDNLSITAEEKNLIIKCIGEKNTHDIAKITGAEKLVKLVSTYGSLDKVLPVLNEIYPNGLSESAKSLVNVITALNAEDFGDKIRIDFSVLNDMNYYSGIVFKGFVKGIFASILSGGQYDNLMKKIGRRAKAIGFAVYLDMLEQFDYVEKTFDVDTLVLYAEGTSISIINKIVKAFSSDGASVLARSTKPSQLKFRQIVKIDEKGGYTIENNA